MAKLFIRLRHARRDRRRTRRPGGAPYGRGHADLAGKLDALPDDWRSHFAKKPAAVSTTAAT
jgi:hypothetical protein